MDNPYTKYDLYGIRVLFFIEEEPQSNKYRQIILTPEEFKKVSMSIGSVVQVDGHDQTVELNLSDELYTLPDLQDHTALVL